VVNNNKSALELLRDACQSADLPDLIRLQHEAASVLLRIARREEFDQPAVATRAAASAARILSDTVAGVVVEERLSELKAEVEDLRNQRIESAGRTPTATGPDGIIGYDADGKVVKTPKWMRPSAPSSEGDT
jgi:hypothetical protein